jgi:hypothetical protein
METEFESDEENDDFKVNPKFIKIKIDKAIIHKKSYDDTEHRPKNYFYTSSMVKSAPSEDSGTLRNKRENS